MKQSCPHCAETFLDIGDLICPFCFKEIGTTGAKGSPPSVSGTEREAISSSTHSMLEPSLTLEPTRNDEGFNTIEPLSPLTEQSPGSLGSKDAFLRASVVTRAELIIDDASRFWWHILISLILIGPGLACLGPIFFLQLLEWQFLAKRNPGLTTPNPKPNSLPSKYQQARKRLLIGFWISSSIWILAAILMVIFLALE